MLLFGLCQRRIWRAADAASRSYVNLALFAPTAEGRAQVHALVGGEVEAWTWLFCRIPRHDLVYPRLVEPLVYGFEGGAPPATPPPSAGLGWRDAAPTYALADGGRVTVADIRTAEPVHLDAYQVGTLLALSIADFAEQWHSWQDGLFETERDGGRMRYAGAAAHTLWPGDGRPGLWLHTLSHVGRLVHAANDALAAAGDARRVPVPPVFDGCTVVVSPAQQAACRDAYWRATTQLSAPERCDEARAALEAAIEACPYVPEPHALLAQLHLQAGRWDQAAACAAQAVRLLLQWGTCFDKRLSFGAWVAWARVCADAARTRTWPAPDQPFAMLNLGLVPQPAA